MSNLYPAAITVLPAVNHQGFVDPHAYAVIGAHPDHIVPAFQRKAARPAGREIVIVHDAGGWRAGGPVVVDAGFVAHQDGRTGKVEVVEVFRLPIRELVSPFPGQHGHGTKQTLEILHADVVRTLRHEDVSNVGGG